MKTVYIEEGNGQYVSLFKELGFKIADTLTKSTSLVCFTGGEDVTPDLYGALKHPRTYSNLHRDGREIKLFAKCVHNKIPMVGICRGAQFLNVMNGGEMYQDVGKHATGIGHMLIDEHRGVKVLVSSTHHQMMLPGYDSVLIAYASERGFREWYEGDILQADISDKDIEVVAYPKTKSLCFQPHPEFTNPEYRPMRVYFASLVDELLQGTIDY